MNIFPNHGVTEAAGSANERLETGKPYMLLSFLHYNSNTETVL